MYFYIDETGHTGPNLFDKNQPKLYYGTLISPVDANSIIKPHLVNLQRKFGFERIHAAELGNSGLLKIIDDLVEIIYLYNIKFSIQTVAKPDHAIISFFDQVFDQGVNPAMTWSGYWTPLRYPLLFMVASLFDEDLAKKAWDARIEKDTSASLVILKEVLETLKFRLNGIDDPRVREILGDSIEWAIINTDSLRYNSKTKHEQLSIMPNTIGFQSVIFGISDYSRFTGNSTRKIVVDQQSQFNKSQKSTLEFYKSAKGKIFELGPGLPKMDLTDIPDTSIEISSSSVCAGLQLVDIFLWIYKRACERKTLAPKLLDVIPHVFIDFTFTEISLNALHTRWSEWFSDLPDASPEMMREGRKLHELQEKMRLSSIKKI